MKVTYSNQAKTYLFKEVTSTKDVIELSKHLLNQGEPETIRYIASELAQNMIDAKLKGNVLVNCKRVETSIFGEDKSDEAKMFLNIAKYAYDRKERLNYKKMGGKGLFSILCIGWDIQVKRESESSYTVVASLREDTEDKSTLEKERDKLSVKV